MRTVPWLLVVALVGATITYLAMRPGEGNADPEGKQRNIPGKDFSVVDDDRGHRLLFEAEDCQEIEKPMEILEGDKGALANASRGRCIYLGPEKVNKDLETSRNHKRSHQHAQYPGFARYVFKAPWTGNYDLWIRAYWVDDCGNSVFVCIDESSKKGSEQKVRRLVPLGGSTFERWTWNPLKKKGRQDSIRLEEGTSYTLSITNREDDVYVDQILLRGGDRDWPDPTEIED